MPLFDVIYTVEERTIRRMKRRVRAVDEAQALRLAGNPIDDRGFVRTTDKPVIMPNVFKLETVLPKGERYP